MKKILLNIKAKREFLHNYRKSKRVTKPRLKHLITVETYYTSYFSPLNHPRTHSDIDI